MPAQYWVQTLFPDKMIKFSFGRDYWIRFSIGSRIKRVDGLKDKISNGQKIWMKLGC